MKKLLHSLICFFILAFVSSLNANTIFVQTPAGGGCDTCSEDFAQNSGATAFSFGANASGQEFQVTESGQLCYIDVWISYIGSTSELECRWGTSADLSTYIASETVSGLGISDDNQYQRWTFDVKGAVSTSTTYYWGCVENSGDIRGAKDTANPYASGDGRYASASGWNMNATDTGQDRRFKVGLCD